VDICRIILLVHTRHGSLKAALPHEAAQAFRSAQRKGFPAGRRESHSLAWVEHRSQASLRCCPRVMLYSSLVGLRSSFWRMVASALLTTSSDDRAIEYDGKPIVVRGQQTERHSCQFHTLSADHLAFA